MHKLLRSQVESSSPVPRAKKREERKKGGWSLNRMEVETGAGEVARLSTPHTSGSS